MVTTFASLGKSTRELFDKHFKFGVLNFEFKTKTKNDIGVTFGGNHDLKSESVAGFLESKLKPTKGVTFKSKVDSNWVFTSEVEVEKKLHEDLKHELIASLETESNKKSLKLNNRFKHDLINLTFDVDFKTRYPHLTGAFLVPVPQFKQIVLGAEATIDTSPFAIKKHVYAVGFKEGDFCFHAALTDHNNVDINVYKEEKDVELGFKMNWDRNTTKTKFGAVVRYKPSSKSAVKLRVDQDCIVGLSYKLKLNSDTNLTLCSELDGKNIESGDHRYGLMLEYDD